MSGYQIPYQLMNAPFEVTDPRTGNPLEVTRWNQVVSLTVAGSETNTLADPTSAGQLLTIVADGYSSGSRVITAASAINQTGNTIMTFGADMDCITLISVPEGGGAYVWRVLANDGVALS